MIEDVVGVRDATLVVPLWIWSGATKALDRGKSSILLRLTVFTANQGFQYHKSQGSADS